ncbi:MAG: phenylacetate--CoA ligase family protein [Eubacteriales bacterium]
MLYYNKSIETATYDEMYHLQSYRLSKTVRHAYDNVALYKQRIDDAGISPDDIKSVDDLCKLPFTQKQDLRDTYPYGMFAVPREKLVRVHASSGTTGKQTVVGYTQNDIDLWSECVARALVAAGTTKDDFVHVSYGYGLFTGGLGLHYGAEKLGATVIPASSGNTARQITMLQDFDSSILCCTPSYALFISDILRQNNIDPKSLHLKSGVFGAEPWSENMRREIESRLNIKAFDIYGLSEICGPGVSFDCEHQNGLHVNEDHFLIEIVDPKTGKPLPDGEAGEVVFTCITKEALPLLRYNTHDISSITHEKCRCGRTLVRMSRITGRSDDMLIIRGVNVFPSQIESVLLSVGQVEPHYMIIVDRQNNLDTIEVKVEMSLASFSDKVSGLEELEIKIKNSMESVLGITAKITFVEANTIQRSEGKAKRVIDNRKL